ncbi:hypothetical protein GCM10007940_40650 [Portibacter lacus]|uniref:Uncharacterized protein n=1 Tax=Portibacter lacus TaxID=1099794 RepID=A0AA37STS1_9BACT|nr:hypothetical protein GCM10007940_40650 [Portibacter lacus]
MATNVSSISIVEAVELISIVTACALEFTLKQSIKSRKLINREMFILGFKAVILLGILG